MNSVNESVFRVTYEEQQRELGDLQQETSSFKRSRSVYERSGQIDAVSIAAESDDGFDEDVNEFFSNDDELQCSLTSQHLLSSVTSSGQAEPRIDVQVSSNAIQLNPVVVSEYSACLLCYESSVVLQRHLHENKSSTTGQSIVNKVANIREVIFAYERSRRGKIGDKHIFNVMLQLRQQTIEKFYIECQMPHERWTLEMIITHYNNHVMDDVREHTKVIDLLKSNIALMNSHRTKLNEETGRYEPDTKILDQIRQHTKRLDEEIKARRLAMEALRLETTAVDRQLSTVLDTLQAQEAATARDNPHRLSTTSTITNAVAIQDLYKIGGI